LRQHYSLFVRQGTEWVYLAIGHHVLQAYKMTRSLPNHARDGKGHAK
jgi:hypothetical protein